MLLTKEDPVALTETKEYIFRKEYLGLLRTTVAIYKLPSYLIDENLAAYMLQFGYIVSVSHDIMHGEWRYDIMIGNKIFYTIPNWLWKSVGCLLL